MIALRPRTNGAPLEVLVLGAHCDDIEIGCGGSLLEMTSANPDIKLTWVVLSSNPQRKEEATLGAQLFTRGARALDLRILDFRDGFFPYQGEAVKDAFESIKAEVDPDLIFTHYRHDLHQDHRIVSELTWNTFRNHLILEYEIPKWDGDLGIPDTFVHLPEAIAEQKIKYLQQAYNSQHTKAWFTDDLFHSLMRIRGMESNSPSLLAEGFYSRKSVLDLGPEK